ncbi:hypothetical protein LIER_16099 [Lithospermum erythrorhizon]|uniref:Uncharacterized protein n=1 Tax=Lithospermum erythrorhizon TaxID=34254 RepID=A0AAV3Q5E3_LITER
MPIHTLSLLVDVILQLPPLDELLYVNLRVAEIISIMPIVLVILAELSHIPLDLRGLLLWWSRQQPAVLDLQENIPGLGTPPWKGSLGVRPVRRPDPIQGATPSRLGAPPLVLIYRVLPSTPLSPLLRLLDPDVFVGPFIDLLTILRLPLEE